MTIQIVPPKGKWKVLGDGWLANLVTMIKRLTKQNKNSNYPETYYHMSGKLFAPGDIISGNGQEKLPEEFEEPLERYRPQNAGPRREFVYCRPNTDFDRCGIVGPKYIYRVEPTNDDKPEVHDLAWIGDMQLALLKRKHGGDHPKYMRRYPDWSDELVRRCCEGYWNGETANPVWEYLFRRVRVVEVISDKPVLPSHTKNGLSPRSQ